MVGWYPPSSRQACRQFSPYSQCVSVEQREVPLVLLIHWQRQFFSVAVAYWVVH